MAFAALALVLFGLVGWLSARHAGSRVEGDAGDALAQVAAQLAADLDVDMFERQREIQNLALLAQLTGAAPDAATWRAVVDQWQRSLPHYAWIGVALPDGRVLAATGGVLEGASVKSRDWFVAGLQQTFVGDVHPAILLASKLPPRGGEPLRLVDVAAPIRINDRVIGVLGAHLDWQWAAERRGNALDAAQRERGVQLMIVDQHGEPLLDLAPGLAFMPVGGVTPLTPGEHSIVEWSDGRAYLTVTARSTGNRDYGGLGWRVVARQPLDTALAAADAVRQTIWSLGLIGALAFGAAAWALAGVLTAPLRQVAARALSVSAGRADLKGQDEIEQLSSALGDLVAQLREREATLLTLNADLERRVAERTESLEVANADLRGFMHNVSHDIKTPIAGVGAVVTHLRQKAGDRLEPAQLRMLEMVAEECQRLRVLVDEMLALAQVEHSTLHHGSVDMDHLVRLVVRDVQNQVEHATTPGFAGTQVDVAPLPPAQGDPVLLRQVWQNLIANAFKFSMRSPAPRLSITAQTESSETVYTVADNGAGFDSTRAERLFGLFQRLHSAGEFPGTGVGLAIVRRIVHRHGGRVWAESQPGHGARFYFTLPAYAPTRNSNPAPPFGPQTLPGGLGRDPMAEPTGPASASV